MSQADFADWPDRFVYVCSAGGAATVNHTPMMQAGEKRVAAVVVLCAISDPDNPTSKDKSHAIEPTKRLKDYAIRALGLDKSRFKVVRGHPNRFGDWENVLYEAYYTAVELGCDIVFNVSGGRTPCKIAPILGYKARQAPPTLRILSVGLAPFSMDIVELGNKNGIVQRPLPIENRTPFSDYLRSYGVVEINREERQKSQDCMLDIAEFAEKILAVFSSFRAGQEKWAMRSAMANLQTESSKSVDDTGNPFPKSIMLGKKHLEFLDHHGLLSGLPGLELKKGHSLVVPDAFSAEVMAGKWLEAAVYSRLNKELKDRNDVEYGCGIRLALNSRDGKEITDLDCAILADERFDIIEAKAVTVLTKFREGIVRLSEYSNMLSGQAGRAWLVAPFLDQQRLNKADMISHADRMGVKLLFGPKAVDDLISGIQER